MWDLGLLSCGAFPDYPHEDGFDSGAALIIHPTRVEVTAEGVKLSALIESTCGDGSELWYEFSGLSAADCSGSADGFLTALLLPAMTNGESIRVLGSVSPRLLRGLEEYQRVFSGWFPERFRPVSISADGFHSEPGLPRAAGAAFSGGVDSTYTLLNHLETAHHDPEGRIQYAVFVHGFDIPLKNEEAYRTAAATYRRLLPSLGVRLVEVRTNVREFADVASWEMAHGSALCSVALMLDRLLSRFYVPASWSYAHLVPWGSHPLIDHLMSTHTLEFVHDGCIPRIDKVAAVAQWELARSWLRVCWERPHGSRNCCRCYNCVLTMVALELAGRLNECPTFPEPLIRARIRKLRLPAEDLAETAEVEIARAVAAGRHDLASDLRVAVRRSRWALALRRSLGR
jgi:hypothetical protein